MDIKLARQNFCDYASYMRGNAIPTLTRYKIVINLFADSELIGDLSDVTKEKVLSFFYNGRTKRKWSSATFISYMNTLSVFFQWCIKENLIDIDHTSELEKPRLTKRIPTKLTQSESARLLEYVHNLPYQNEFLRCRNHAIFSMFIFTGLRRMELLNLKFVDVDMEGLCLFVRQGKGNKDRVVPISYQLAETLNKYLVQRKRLKRTCPEFFTSFNNDRSLSVDGLKHLVDNMNKKMKIKFGLHQLRHTFATLMLEGGCDIYSLSKMLGHSDIKTTTIYLAASTNHLKEQMFKHPLNKGRLK